MKQLAFLIAGLIFSSNSYSIGDGAPTEAYQVSAATTFMPFYATTTYPIMETTAISKAASDKTARSIKKKKEDKIILAAKDDALTYLATDGKYKTARLENAIQIMKDRHGALLNETEIIKKISTYNANTDY